MLEYINSVWGMTLQFSSTLSLFFCTDLPQLIGVEFCFLVFIVNSMYLIFPLLIFVVLGVS